MGLILSKDSTNGIDERLLEGHGLYTIPQDYDKKKVRKLIISRKLAPFYRGNNYKVKKIKGYFVYLFTSHESYNVKLHLFFKLYPLYYPYFLLSSIDKMNFLKLFFLLLILI